LVERIVDSDAGVQKIAVEQLRSELTQATGTVTSVPKPLKFLKPRYDLLKEAYAKAPESNQKLFANLLSVLAMTMGKEEDREMLKYRLVGTDDDLENWGHEYVRFVTIICLLNLLVL
jgi:26S proteasome regulatory subunit N1